MTERRERTARTAKSKGRNARFAVRVVVEYRYTCALTGYRCVTDDGAAVVDAAHKGARRNAACYDRWNAAEQPVGVSAREGVHYETS